MKVVLFGEKGKFNRLLLIDGVLCLSDKWSAFTSFLRITWKLKHICLYIEFFLRFKNLDRRNLADGSSKYRSDAENQEEQRSYFNINSN